MLICTHFSLNKLSFRYNEQLTFIGLITFTGKVMGISFLFYLHKLRDICTEDGDSRGMNWKTKGDLDLILECCSFYENNSFTQLQVI
jgi:hypothetical protein